MPGVNVFGVIAVVLPTPVKLVYHFNVFPAAPVAAKIAAVAFWQYANGVAAVGAIGVEFTFTTIVALGPSTDTEFI